MTQVTTLVPPDLVARFDAINERAAAMRTGIIEAKALIETLVSGIAQTEKDLANATAAVVVALLAHPDLAGASVEVLQATVAHELDALGLAQVGIEVPQWLNDIQKGRNWKRLRDINPSESYTLGRGLAEEKHRQK